MTRSEIQTQIDIIKEMPEYNGSLSFVSQQLASWLLSSGVDQSESDKILNDIESYVI